MSDKEKKPILVAEQDLATRRLVDSLLSSYGYAPEIAKNYTQALSSFQDVRRDYGVVLLDTAGLVRSTEKNLLSQFEKTALQRGVPLIAYTSDALKADLDYSQHSFADIMVKPMRNCDFLKTVQKYL